MKKLILLTIAVIIAVTLYSQDIYTSGYFTNDSGPKIAAVFKNGEVILSREEPGRDLFSSAMVIDTLNGDIYWSANAFPLNSISDSYGNVMKNDEILLDNVIGTCINDISFDGGDIYSAGYMNDIYESIAAVWKNGETTPLYTYCTDKHSSVVLGIDVVDGVVYACGYYEEGLHYGCVWVNGDLYAIHPNSEVTGITYHDGDIYYLLDECTTSVYKSGEELYELQNYGGSCSDVDAIIVADDDVYSVGFLGFIDCLVWRNADCIYLHPFGRDAAFTACQYFEQSLYYVGWDHMGRGIVFKDGMQLYSLDNCAFYDVWVRPSPLAIEEIEAEDSSVVYIYNFFGELVKTVYTDGDDLNVNDLPSGFYIAKRGKEVVKVFSAKVE